MRWPSSAWRPAFCPPATAFIPAVWSTSSPSRARIDWHGDAFEFVRNGDVNALNYFATAQDSLKRNQFGGTFGGHIIRDKLFFFGGIQETIVRQDPSGSSAFIPTTAALNGDFSSLDGAGCQSSGMPAPSRTRKQAHRSARPISSIPPALIRQPLPS